MAVIYALVDPNDGAVRYIGYTKNSIEKRFSRHIGLAKKGDERKVYVWIRDVLSRGKFPLYTILENIIDSDIERERFWIQYGINNGWNLTNQTSGGFGVISYQYTQEVRKRMSESSKRMWSDPEFRKKAIEPRIGLKRSDETRKKMSESMRGIKRSPQSCINIGNSKRGIKYSEETRKNMGSKKGKTFSDETRKKISESLKGNKNQVGKHMSEKAKERCRETWRLKKLGITTERPRSHHAKD